MAIGSALSVGLIGLKAFIVQIQAFVSPGLPYFSIIGLPDNVVEEICASIPGVVVPAN